MLHVWTPFWLPQCVKVHYSIITLYMSALFDWISIAREIIQIKMS